VGEEERARLKGERGGGSGEGDDLHDLLGVKRMDLDGVVMEERDRVEGVDHYSRRLMSSCERNGAEPAHRDCEGCSPIPEYRDMALLFRR
jgi:hypothetical protein